MSHSCQGLVACDAVWCCRMLPTVHKYVLPTYHTITRRQIPEDLDLKHCSRENLKTRDDVPHFAVFSSLLYLLSS